MKFPAARIAALLVLLTLFAGVLRFAAIGFGLPDRFRPDEEYLVANALGFQEDSNPHFAIYPAAQIYLLHAALRLSTALEGHEGDFHTAYAGAAGLGRAHLIGRGLAATFGTASVPALYWALAPAWGTGAGLAAAAVLATSTLHVRESKYATTDAACTFWLVLAIGAALRVVRGGRLRSSLALGVFTGLATATKYPAAAFLVALGLAHIGARHREGRSLWRTAFDLRAWSSVWVAAAVFVAVTPWLWLDWAQTVADFEYQRGFVTHGIGNAFSGHGWLWLLGTALPDSLGPELALATIAATLWAALVRRPPGAFSLLAFLLVAAAGISASHYVFYRYLLVPLPVLAAFTGLGLAAVGARLRARFGNPIGFAITLLLVAALLLPGTIRDYKLIRLFGRRDSRTMAREWIEQNVPPGVPIATTVPDSPYGKPQLEGRNPWILLDSPMSLASRGVHWVLLDESPLRFYSPPAPADLIESLQNLGQVRLDVNPHKPASPEPVFDQADAFYIPLQHGSSMKRPGPRIRIWEIDPTKGKTP